MGLRLNTRSNSRRLSIPMAFGLNQHTVQKVSGGIRSQSGFSFENFESYIDVVIYVIADYGIGPTALEGSPCHVMSCSC